MAVFQLNPMDTLQHLEVCATSVCGDELCQMFKVIQCFGKHGNCHLQVECVLVGYF
jgi:hypothetical protein